MELVELLARLANGAKQQGIFQQTLTHWYADIQAAYPQHQALLALQAIQASYTCLGIGATGTVATTQEALHQAITALHNWLPIATMTPFWLLSETNPVRLLNRNDRWAMYVGMEATTEVLAEHDYRLTTMRAEVHESDSGAPFDLRAQQLLTRVRTLRACGEAILMCWEQRPQLALYHLQTARATIEVWQELEREAALIEPRE